jgi:hypothetical protein
LQLLSFALVPSTKAYVGLIIKRQPAGDAIYTALWRDRLAAEAATGGDAIYTINLRLWYNINTNCYQVA